MRLARFNRHVEMLTRRFKSGKYEPFAPSGPGLVTKDGTATTRTLPPTCYKVALPLFENPPPIATASCRDPQVTAL